MCGVLFSYNIRKEENLEMLKKLSIRGRDGYGVIAMNTHTKKRLENVFEFLSL